MAKILLISLKLKFTPNSLGYKGLIGANGFPGATLFNYKPLTAPDDFFCDPTRKQKEKSRANNHDSIKEGATWWQLGIKGCRDVLGVLCPFPRGKVKGKEGRGTRSLGERQHFSSLNFL